MKKLLLIYTFLLSVISCSAGNDLRNEGKSQEEKTEIQDTKNPIFEDFIYTGKNILADWLVKPGSQYLNPILPGFYPDPSICRVGKDYYLVTSSFAYYPGVPIFHSTDLINWKQIGHVLDRPSQLNLKDGIGISDGIYAPDIKYNPHNRKFYMITTGVYAGGNFYVTTDDPKKGNWSDPVKLPEVGGIDPGLFFDEDGKAYIVNNAEPDHEPEYSGHRAIWIREFDWKNNCVIGEQKVIIDGGVDKSQKPSWIEGPHLYKINGKYYLMAAEGGTGPSHREVVFVSDSPMGAYQPCPVNPILTQKGLASNREYPVNCTGHADLVQTEAGDWFAVFLGTRDYKSGHANTGRETFLLPVTWENEQPIILPQGEAVPYVVDMTEEMKILRQRNTEVGDNFYIPSPLWTKEGLSLQAVQVRTPSGQCYRIVEDGTLILEPGATQLNEKKSPSFIGRRINSWLFSARTALTYTPSSEKDFAGIALFQDESCYIRFGKTQDGRGKTILLLEAYRKGVLEKRFTFEIPEDKLQEKLNLRVNAITADSYAFYYSLGSVDDWKIVGTPVDATILSTKTAGGFTGAMIGIYATSDKK